MITQDLTRVQELIEHYVASNVTIVDRIGRYVGENSGKKLRPAILLLTARLFNTQSESLHHLGALVELIHTATLVHDDIIDEAETRRGRPSTNTVFGNEITVLMGDWLYMTAFQIAVNQRNFRILDVLIDVTRKMVEGELIQLDFLGRADISIEENLDIASRKTAFLFSACTRLGGVVGNCSEDELERLFRIGLNLGLAFQLVDDVLDYTADEQKLGKPIMNDLREGKVTLPVIYLLQENQPAHREMVDTILREKDFRTVTPESLISALRQHNCIDRAMSYAHSFATSARVDIQQFPPSPARDALTAIADFILAREN